jgi:hypothetical protein
VSLANLADVMENSIPNTQNENIQYGLDGDLTFDASGEKEFPLLNGHNLGNRTLMLCLPMREFYDRSFVANQQNLNEAGQFREEAIAQRKLDPAHTLGLAKYILKGLFASQQAYYDQKGITPSTKFNEMNDAIGRQPYMSLQPIVANIRACKAGGADLKFKRHSDGKISVFLANAHVLWVIDGQHRREAMHLVSEFLQEVAIKHVYPKKPLLFADAAGSEVEPAELAVWNDINQIARANTTVLVEVHLGLNADQERQLFFDLNNYAKKVDSGLAYNFDQSNPINLYIKKNLELGKLLKANLVDKDKLDWDNHDGSFSRKDIVAVNAILFLNRTNIKSASPSKVKELESFADNFWKIVSDIPGFGEPHAKKITVAAQPVVLKALAKLFNQFNSGKNIDINALQNLINGIRSGKMDFSHKNKVWRYYQFLPEDREAEFPGLSAFLAAEEQGNRDIGMFNATDGVMRFGAKHNDIFPIIGDMIRWALDLPNRHVVKS